MKPEPLVSLYAKIEWANSEIEKLNTAIIRYFETNPCEVKSKINAEGTEEIWRFHWKHKIPESMRIQVGNILKNLRDPLDQVLAAVSMMHRGKNNGVSFPFGSAIHEYEAEIAKLEKLLPTDAIELIRRANTQRGGNSHLRGLHFINREDKHRSGLVIINMSGDFSMSSLKVFEGGYLIRMGYTHGQSLVAPAKPVKPSFTKGQAIIKPAPAGPVVQFKPNIEVGDDDMEFLTTTPGTIFEAELMPSLNIAFGKAAGLEREPIVVALHQTSQLVEGNVLTFERRFFP
jgi:hypothetical protein